MDVRVLRRLDLRSSWLRLAAGIFLFVFALGLLISLVLCLGTDGNGGGGPGPDCSLMYIIGWSARWAGLAMFLGTFIIGKRDPS